MKMKMQMQYKTILMLLGIACFSLFSCGSEVGVEIPHIVEYKYIEGPPGEVIIKEVPVEVRVEVPVERIVHDYVPVEKVVVQEVPVYEIIYVEGEPVEVPVKEIVYVAGEPVEVIKTVYETVYVPVEVPVYVPVEQPKEDPGGIIKIEKGKPNVIIEYVNQDYKEFVRLEDGKVKYTVYDDLGQKAPGAIVKGLPEIDPSKEYVADANRSFIVPPEDLPVFKDLTLRQDGTNVKVQYANSEDWVAASSGNIQVPNRMFVRLRLLPDTTGNKAYLDKASYMAFPAIIVERNNSNPHDESCWQQIPAYLGSAPKNIRAFRCYQNGTYYPGSPDTRDQYTIDPTSINISSAASLRVTRLRKQVTYFTSVTDFATLSAAEKLKINMWDEIDDHYFTLVLNDTLYGDKAKLDAVIKMAPVQAGPMIKDLTVSVYNPETKPFFNYVIGNLNIIATGLPDSIDYRYVFKPELNPPDATHPYYYPVQENEAVVKAAAMFIVRFNVTGNNTSNIPKNKTDKPLASINDPSFRVTTPYLGASVVLECDNSYFYTLNTVGYLEFEKEAVTGQDDVTKPIMRPRPGAASAPWAKWKYSQAIIPVTGP